MIKWLLRTEAELNQDFQVSHDPSSIKHFYINEEQSIYLLSHKDARRQRAWIKLCQAQLKQLGYSDIELVGKGAFGFAFAGRNSDDKSVVFKFSRMTLPESVQDRLEDEGYMQSRVKDPKIPAYIDFQRVGSQRILVMDRAPGADLDRWVLEHGSMEPRLVVRIASQLARLLTVLRNHHENHYIRPIVHGDIKPSNVVYDPITENVQLIDWGSSVYAQLDEQGQPVAGNIMDLMSGLHSETNARLGDVYFIGPEQMAGKKTSSRFDEQGIAATLYAISANMPCRFGHKIIRPESLGLPVEFARMLAAMLSEDVAVQRQAGDYFVRHMSRLANLVMPRQEPVWPSALLPVWVHEHIQDIETVVYSSRKSFLRQRHQQDYLSGISDAQLDKYYKNYLTGMGETEKAMLATVSRLGQFPLLGGLAIKWTGDGQIEVDSSLNLYKPSMKRSFIETVNNLVHLARSLKTAGIFKACMFNAKDTLHIERESVDHPFVPDESHVIEYEVMPAHLDESQRVHSYFEDGDDPDELLQLPAAIMHEIEALNAIHHTGLVIFEALETHLKIHNYYRLLDETKEAEFASRLKNLVSHASEITGLGISGFMKFPYIDTRSFSFQDKLPDHFYPVNPFASVGHEKQFTEADQ